MKENRKTPDITLSSAKAQFGSDARALSLDLTASGLNRPDQLVQTVDLLSGQWTIEGEQNVQDKTGNQSLKAVGLLNDYSLTYNADNLGPKAFEVNLKKFKLTNVSAGTALVIYGN